MVYVNSKKYACEACIKGHRSSSCHHNDRPLFEIKKKGRPVSQCDKCREARKSRRIHAKCTCETERNESTSVTPVNGVKQKGKRFIPTEPALPNGLKDALRKPGSPSSELNGPKRPVDALLNPCHCKDVYNCRCRPGLSDATPILDTLPRRRIDPAIFSDGLSALALVASCCSPAASPVLPPLSSAAEGVGSAGYSVSARAPHDESGLPASGNPKRKRTPRSSPAPDNMIFDVDKQKTKLFRSIAPAPSGSRNESRSAPVATTHHESPLPSIPTLMNLSADKAPVDERSAKNADISRCCCGTRCECAECEIHDPVALPKSQPSWVDDPAEAAAVEGSSSSTAHPAHPASHGHSVNCAEDCPTCVDYDGGIELPPLKNTSAAAASALSSSQSSSSSSTPSYLAAFLARAASLPAPPPHARSSLDPTNITIYPTGLFTRPRGASEGAGAGAVGATVSDDSLSNELPRAFGLVRVPKLEECCGGRCGCAEDACGCGDKCDGCCMDAEGAVGDGRDNEVETSRASVSNPTTLETSRLSPSVSFARRSVDVSPPGPRNDAEPPKSCCSRT